MQYQKKSIYLPSGLADQSDIDIDEINYQFQALSSKNYKEVKLSNSKSKQKSHPELTHDRKASQLRLKSDIIGTEEQFFLKASTGNSGEETCKSMMKKSRSYTSRNNIDSRKSNANSVLNATKFDAMKKRKKWLQLKDVITNQKVQVLKDSFIQKLRRNNPYSKPVQHNLEDLNSDNNFLDHKGIQLKQWMQKIISLLSILNIMSSIFIYTLALVFAEIRQSELIQIIEVFSIILYLIEIVLNLTVVRFSLGHKLETLKDISMDYIKHRFFIDFANILIVSMNLISLEPILSYLRLITLLKISDCMDKLQKLEVFFIENYYNQQYWSLVKVFLFNFCFAHILAIILAAMSNVNPVNNWMITKNIINAAWYQKYIWSYYWASTIMLTIGFGDMVPVCYEEACCMIFIETISCIVLAYNINCVGSLISNIRSQDIEKSKNLKIFKKLADKHHITESLNWKINNYIEEHTNIKKLFNIEEEVQFVSKLPTAYRTDYLKEANKTIFQKLFFFNHLMEKTLFSLAEKIEMKITHPQEIILNSERNFDLLILKNGQIGFTSRKINRDFNKFVIDQVIVKENDQPFLLHTNFITKKRSIYGIKSIVYSVLYYLEFDSLMDTLREGHLDYELYCQMKDKSKNKLDEFEVFPCKYCLTKHTKFSCPKLHFIPISQHVLNKYISHEKQGKNERVSVFQRIQQPKQSALIRYMYNKQIYAQKKQEEKQSTMAVAKRMKKQNFVIDQLRALDNDNGHDEFPKEKTFKNMKNMEMLAKMQSKFLQSTTQIIKVYIAKAFGIEKGEDEVWTLDLDRMKNYKDYFSEDNPCNIEKKFDVDFRQKGKAQKEVFSALAKCFNVTETHQSSSDKKIKTSTVQGEASILEVDEEEDPYTSLKFDQDFPLEQ